MTTRRGYREAYGDGRAREELLPSLACDIMPLASKVTNPIATVGIESLEAIRLHRCGRPSKTGGAELAYPAGLRMCGARVGRDAAVGT